MQMQVAVVYCSFALYIAHLLSVPMWLYACLREFRNQQKMRTASEPRVPNAGEFLLLRCFLVYALADAVRNADAVFEGDDGLLYSMWGVGSMGMRLIAWWVRDAACFVGVAILLQFTLGWTHAALGRPVPKGLVAGLWASCAFVVIGLAIGFNLVLATNSMAWVVLSALSLLPLNIGMALMNARLLWSVFPELQLLAKKANDKQASAMIFQSWTSSCMMLVFNVSFLTIVPALCIDKVSQGAFSIPVARAPLGTWIGGSALPGLVDLPPNVQPVPIMEAMELVLGWLNVAACVLSSRGYSMTHGQLFPGRFIDSAALGKDVGLRLGMCSERAKSE